MKKNRKQTLLTALLSLALALAVLPGTVLAEGGMPIFVATRSGEQITLFTEPTDRVEEIKVWVEEQTGIPAGRQMLVFQGTELVEGNTLQDYTIRKNSVIQLMVAANGSGTAEDPCLLSTAEELDWFAWQVNAGRTDLCARVTGDISLGGTAWTPIGSASAPYAGTFDGGAFTIADFSVTGGSNQGLFGCCENAVLKNIVTANATVEGAGCVGGIVGSAVGGSITDCENGASLASSGVSCGGIAGACTGVSVTGCVNNGDILRGSYQNGGIVGSATGSVIDRCTNNGSICNADHSGGIAAYNTNGTVSNCLNTGSIATTATFYCYTAGIVANNVGADAVVENCLNVGSVSGAGGTGCRVNTIVCANDNGGTRARNCFSLEGLGQLGLADGSSEVSAAELASGSVAWRLNGQAAGVWKQTIGVDAIPGFAGDPVYPLGDGSYGPVCDHVLSAAQPTCTEDAVCTLCGAVLPAAGHRYGAPVWSWTEDGTGAAVTFSCTVDGHAETPAVEVTAQVVTPASCTEKGVTRYTAKTVFDGTEYTDVRAEADIPAAGHRFVDGVCTVCGAADPDYGEYEQTGDSWTRGDGSASVPLVPEIGAVDSVFVDDRELTEGEDYTVEDGRLVIRPEVLESLGEGAHTILVKGENGTLKITLTVKAQAQASGGASDQADSTAAAQTLPAGESGSPVTGDSGSLVLWAALLAASAAGLAGVTVWSKRNRL